VFDRVVVVDWSANSSPKRGRDSIWIAVREHTGEISITNPPTRAAAESFLVELFESDPTISTLVGVDFSLGYPVGTAGALGLSGPPWSAMAALLADRIVDDDRNVNNRFTVAAGLNECITGTTGPFWGCPPTKASRTLAPTKSPPPDGLAEWRTVEMLLRSSGRRPFSSWQLLGAGAVGSQSLLGVPMIVRLGERFAERIDVWPFTTGLASPTIGIGGIVVAEVWPSLVELGDRVGVRDAAQVEATANWLAETDRCGRLRALFAPTLTPEVVAAATGEEGWVLGVTP
jgi:hypothetical protein